jgi:hypothetical protein
MACCGSVPAMALRRTLALSARSSPAPSCPPIQHLVNLNAAFAYACPCGRQCLKRVIDCHAKKKMKEFVLSLSP